MSGDVIGIRKQVSLEAGHVETLGTDEVLVVCQPEKLGLIGQSSLVKQAGDLGDCVAFRNRDRVVHDVPVAEYSENLRRTHAGMQRVFARRDSAIRPVQSAQNLEAPLAGDQALM